MKKILCFLLCTFLLTGLCSCSKNGQQSESDSQMTDSSINNSDTGNSDASDADAESNGSASQTGSNSENITGVTGSHEVVQGLRASAEENSFKMFSGDKIFGYTKEDYVEAIISYKELKLELGSDFEKFCNQVNNMYEAGIDYMGLGIPYCTQFGLGFAQGSAAAVRYAVELKLNGMGVTLETDDLPRDWDVIHGISYITPAAFYMEALSVENADPDRAQFLREQGELNPLYEEFADLEDLINAADEAALKELYTKLTDYEKEIYLINPIIPNPIEERNGYMYSSDFHIVAVSWCLENKDMASAVALAENVIITNPFDIAMYIYAAQVALTAGDVNAAIGFVNNGLLFDETSGDINLYAALMAYGSEDMTLAAEYFENAEKYGVSEQYSELFDSIRNAVKGVM